MTSRHTKILEILTTAQRIEVTVLSEMLKVSQVTVRKDLDFLEGRGLINREHGFASLETVDDAGKSLAFRYSVKRRIAKAAAETVEEGETVMIESGSCCALLAEELTNTKRDVTIVTNSIFIANHVRNAPCGKIILLGGYYQNDSQVMVGSITVKCAEIFFSDKFFIGVDGFTDKLGFTGKDHHRAQTVRGLAEQASQVIVLTESDKFFRHGVVGIVNTNDVAAVYTDDRIPQEVESFLLENEVQLVKVNSSSE
ncbi:MAG: DeoR/GlpR family DNA-binding transcription regulator [Treponema sp.]|jgi:DeoR/GlpR family transcriptional regulator of sugar metabolism|nr:DeoR/GlpR family DNA-binding transcription regulator [Treponema sp.]